MEGLDAASLARILADHGLRAEVQGASAVLRVAGEPEIAVAVTPYHEGAYVEVAALGLGDDRALLDRAHAVNRDLRLARVGWRGRWHVDAGLPVEDAPLRGQDLVARVAAVVRASRALLEPVALAPVREPAPAPVPELEPPEEPALVASSDGRLRTVALVVGLAFLAVVAAALLVAAW